MKVEVRGKIYQVPGCFQKGWIERGGELLPCCASNDCSLWGRCLNGGRVGESGVLEVGGKNRLVDMVSRSR